MLLGLILSVAVNPNLQDFVSGKFDETDVRNLLLLESTVLPLYSQHELLHRVPDVQSRDHGYIIAQCMCFTRD